MIKQITCIIGVLLLTHCSEPKEMDRSANTRKVNTKDTGIVMTIDSSSTIEKMNSNTHVIVMDRNKNTGKMHSQDTGRVK